MKKAISILLAVIFAISLMPFALADSAATITAYNSADVQVGTTYTTIDAAAAAAGQGGKVCISAGVLEVSGRQTISVSGVTLEGAGRGVTTIKPSASFANASETNRKAILTIAADNVTVKDLSLDGTDYGETVSGSTDFVVLRVNSGNGIMLNNVFVTGSYKTLLQVGMSSATASVTATDFYCEGMTKSISNASIYADIDVNSGSTLIIESGAVNGFFATEGNAVLQVCDGAEPIYTLSHTYFIFLKKYVTSTFQHFAETYVNLREELGTFVEDYAADLSDSDNQDTVSEMVAYAAGVADEYPEAVSAFIVLLTDAQQYADSEDVPTLQAYVTTLTAALNS